MKVSVGENGAACVGEIISLAGELADIDDVDTNDDGLRTRSLAIS